MDELLDVEEERLRVVIKKEEENVAAKSDGDARRRRQQQQQQQTTTTTTRDGVRRFLVESSSPSIHRIRANAVDADDDARERASVT